MTMRTTGMRAAVSACAGLAHGRDRGDFPSGRVKQLDGVGGRAGVCPRCTGAAADDHYSPVLQSGLGVSAAG